MARKVTSKKHRICKWCGNPMQKLLKFCCRECADRFQEKQLDDAAPMPEEIAERAAEIRRQNMEKKRSEQEWKHQYDARNGATVRMYSLTSNGWECV